MTNSDSIKLLNKRSYFLIIAVMGFTLYVSAYFFCFEVFRVSWHGDAMKFRLFDNIYQVKLWYPLIKIEEMLTKKDVEFYWHIRNGASLPYDTDDDE